MGKFLADHYGETIAVALIFAGLVLLLRAVILDYAQRRRILRYVRTRRRVVRLDDSRSVSGAAGEPDVRE